MFKNFIVMGLLSTSLLACAMEETTEQSTNMPPQSPLLRMLSPELPFSGAGCIDILGGPMASGKSLALMRAISILKVAGIKTLVCKHSFDTRSAEHIISRMKLADPINAHLITDPSEILDLVKQDNYTAIAIDEVQFFTAQALIPVIKTLLQQQKYIVAAGLLKDVFDEDFGCNQKEPLCMRELRRIARPPLKLKAVCMHCKQLPPSASKTQRLVDGQPSKKSDPLILIDDGSHKEVVYEARCKHCFRLPE